METRDKLIVSAEILIIVSMVSGIALDGRNSFESSMERISIQQSQMALASGQLANLECARFYNMVENSSKLSAEVSSNYSGEVMTAYENCKNFLENSNQSIRASESTLKSINGGGLIL